MGLEELRHARPARGLRQLPEKGKHHEGDQQCGEGCAKGPIARREELVIDQVADHLLLAAAQEIRRYKVSDRKHEYENRARRHPCRRQRQGDFEKCRHGRGAEITRGFRIGGIEPLQGGINREDDEGCVVVDEAEDDREFIVEDGQWLRNHACIHQDIVDHAHRIEQHDPGIGADEVIRPEGQDGEKQKRRLPAFRRAHDGIGGGIADEQGERRGNECYAGAVEKNRQVKGIERPGEIVERGRTPVNPAIGAALEKHEYENQQARHDHQRRQPQQARRHEQP
jgi:hypothetical protein